MFVVLEMVLALACLALWPALRRRGSEFVWGVVLGWIASFVAILCLTLVWILTVVNLTAESVASGQT